MMEHSGTPASVAVSTVLHTHSPLKLMFPCLGAADCATEQPFRRLCHFLPFHSIRPTRDGPGVTPVRSTPRGWLGLGEGSVPAVGGAGSSPLGSQNPGKHPLNGSRERPFAASVSLPAGHKHPGRFGRTEHRSAQVGCFFKLGLKP